ncbi:MAG: ATP phosphoribosyltransferase regulatory subunit [Alphaproteobacteria bacterium]
MTPLLPIGLHDSLGTEAYWLNRLKQTCLQTMYGFGYDLVEPTPLEQEDKTQPPTGESRFRVHDPSTEAPLVLRSDITPQIARIAKQHYAGQGYPIRLGYVGQVFRMRASQMKPERQSTQVGAEFYADQNTVSQQGLLEVLRLLFWLMRTLSVGPCVLDLSHAGLARRIMDLAGLSPEQRCALAVKQKPEGMTPEGAALIEPLLQYTGPKASGLVGIYPESLDADILQMLALQAQISALCPHVRVSIDWVDGRYLSYHQGIGFHLFALGEDIGRGGLYTSQGLHGVGFSFYLDPLVRHAVLHHALPPEIRLSPTADDHTIAHALAKGQRIVWACS